MHTIVIIVCLLTLATLQSASSASLNSVVSLDEELVLKWTTTALKFFDFRRCVRVNLADEKECYQLSLIRRQQMAIYIGRARTEGVESVYFYEIAGKGNRGANRKKVFAILPDSVNAKESQPHDVILAIDPYPSYNFGHLVGLFYVDFSIEDRLCQEDNQILIMEITCITLARKSRCPNLLEHRNSPDLPKRCHTDFLPTVHMAGMSHSVSSAFGPSESNLATDLLECIRLPGFSSCPKLRPIEDTEKVMCDSAHANSKRCDTSYSGVGTRCRLFQTCDRGVLIGGGWNRFHSSAQSLLNMLKLSTMLQRNGFLGDNIKIFYGNGGQPISDSENGEFRQMLSSAMKTGLRGHLKTICGTRHCADTLFVYLNNPTTSEGDMLLWDVDNNGLANELEVYTTKEFLSDISHCAANRVVLVLEQSNTEGLINALKTSPNHQNVIAFAAGLSGQVTINGEMSEIWANNSHPTYCLQHLHETCKRKMRQAVPVVQDNSVTGNLNKLSIVGAPCKINPPLTQRELHSLYQGCQNVPTSVWFSANYPGVALDEGEVDDDGSHTDEVGSSNNRRL